MFRWDVVGQYIFSSFFLQAAWLTLWVAVVAQLAGVVLGLFLALLRMSRFPLFSLPAAVYIWLFRGSPLLVQILLFYNGLSRVSGINLPGIECLLFALALNEGAYMAEIIRAGITSVDPGQMEAGKALGMRSSLAMRRIVLPQALRVIVPPLGNEFNNMLKSTSLGLVVGVMDLTGTASIFGSTSFTTFELLVVATFYYLVLTTLWEYVQRWIENRLDPNRTTKFDLTDQKSWSQRIAGIGAPKGTMVGH